MRKATSLFLVSLISISVFFVLPSAAAVACSDTWDIPIMPGEITLLDKKSIPLDFNEHSQIPISQFQKGMELGQTYLIFKDYFTPLPPAYFQKITEGGREIAITGQWKRSLDGKNWSGFAGIRGDLLPINSPIQFQSAPNNSKSADRVYSVVDASRMGIVPNARIAFELKIDIKGCEQRIIYEHLSTVPQYSISTKSLDVLIQTLYSVDPSSKKLNFIAQESCNQTLNTFISHLTDVSKKSQIWTIQNTKRGTLDLGWSLTARENTTCSSGGDLPGFDLQVSPSFGDGCINLLTPLTSTFSYKTIKYPCHVSIDLKSNFDGGSFEIAKFEITRKIPALDTQQKDKTITCTNGKLSKKITSASPKCPKGFKVK